MIGTHLAAALRERGDEVWILTRRDPKEEFHVQWDPTRGIQGVARLEGLDGVFNLTGAPIADRPWTKKRREILHDSRIAATEVILESLAQLDQRPGFFIGAGGLGLFGDCGDAEIPDDAEPGTGFLAELSRDWEVAHLAASEVLGCRAAVLRMTIVLSASGGAFPLMVLPFRYGIGGWLGNGQQYTSWISDRDCIAAFLFVAGHDDLAGAFNATVPDPVRNKEWCKALGRALNRPVMTHAPKWALRGALGELANDLFLASIRAVPKRLTEAGFTFEDTDPEATFARLAALL
ncbi:MAG: TIGR01777 family protein [Alphaproteobacteria bacterium]|nr:TIGR01777 family protein [Alphaproteobacteria bacterium]